VELLEVRIVVQNECLSIKSRIEALYGDRQPLVNERCFAAVTGFCCRGHQKTGMRTRSLLLLLLLLYLSQTHWSIAKYRKHKHTQTHKTAKQSVKNSNIVEKTDDIKKIDDYFNTWSTMMTTCANISRHMIAMRVRNKCKRILNGLMPGRKKTGKPRISRMVTITHWIGSTREQA